MYAKFSSLMHGAEFGYSFNSDGCESCPQVGSNYRMFQTFGDGLCQHSHDWTITREYLADYLYSLASAMLTNDQLAERMTYPLMARPSVKEIEFAASVVYKPMSETQPWEKKPRYYSVAEKKITTAGDKQYDKRYAKVETWNDGGAMAIFQMLIPDWSDGLMRFCYVEAIREWAFAADDRPYMQLSALFLEWTKDPDAAREMAHGLEAAKAVVESRRLRAVAESNIESVRRNVERRAAMALEAETVAA
jgi:hypothetical protein